MRTDTNASPGRWVGAGQVQAATPREAATKAAMAALTEPDPRLVLVFGACADPAEEIAAGVATATAALGCPDVPVIGCSTTGLIGPTDEPQPDAGVVVVALGGDLDVATALGTGFNHRPREVGEEIAAALQPATDRPDAARPYQVALMLTDNLAGDQQDLIRGAYSGLGATIPQVGAVSGNGPVPEPSWQIFQSTARRDSVVAALVGSGAPVGIAVRHGWRSGGTSMIATASAGNELHCLDDRPALDVFLVRHDAPPGIENDPVAFHRFALVRPLAISRRGELAIRHVLAADLNSRALICAATVPKGAAVWQGTTDTEPTVAAADLACAAAVAELSGKAPKGLLVFDCAGRRAVLQGDGLRAEHDAIRRHAGDAAIAGFYGNGEIARVHGAHGFHNQTVVACAIG